MNINKLFEPKIGSIYAVLCPIILILTILFSISISPWFSWQYNYLSDLGGNIGDRPIYAAHGYASIIFNVGILFSGIFGILFAISFKFNYPIKSRIGRFGKWLLIVDMISLAGIGIFPEPTYLLHGFMAVTFFILMPFSMMFIGVGIFRAMNKKEGLPVILLSICSYGSLFILVEPQPVGNNAIGEIIPTMFYIIFLILSGYKLYMEKQ